MDLTHFHVFCFHLKVMPGFSQMPPSSRPLPPPPPRRLHLAVRRSQRRGIVTAVGGRRRELELAEPLLQDLCGRRLFCCRVGALDSS